MQGLIIIFMSNAPNASLELEVNEFTITYGPWTRIYVRAKLKAVVVVLFFLDLFFWGILFLLSWEFFSPCHSYTDDTGSYYVQEI